MPSKLVAQNSKQSQLLGIFRESKNLSFGFHYWNWCQWLLNLFQSNDWFPYNLLTITAWFEQLFLNQNWTILRAVPWWLSQLRRHYPTELFHRSRYLATPFHYSESWITKVPLWNQHVLSTIWFLELTVVLRLKVHWKCETTSTCSTTRKLAWRSITNGPWHWTSGRNLKFCTDLELQYHHELKEPARIYYMVPWAHGGIETQGPLEMWDNVYLLLRSITLALNKWTLS